MSSEGRPWGCALLVVVGLVIGASALTAVVVDRTTGSDEGCRDAPVVLEGEVTHVVDGDTLDVGSTRVRLAIVDTPEVHSGVEPGGPESQAFVASWAMGERVLVHRPAAPYEDRYDRVLGEVMRARDCASLNVALVDAGLGEPVARYCAEDPDLARRIGCGDG